MVFSAIEFSLYSMFKDLFSLIV